MNITSIITTSQSPHQADLWAWQLLSKIILALILTNNTWNQNKNMSDRNNNLINKDWKGWKQKLLKNKVLNAWTNKISNSSLKQNKTISIFGETSHEMGNTIYGSNDFANGSESFRYRNNQTLCHR